MSEIIDVNKEDLEKLIKQVSRDIRKAFGTLIPGDGFKIEIGVSGDIDEGAGEIIHPRHTISFKRWD